MIKEAPDRSQVCIDFKISGVVSRVAAGLYLESIEYILDMLDALDGYIAAQSPHKGSI